MVTWILCPNLWGCRLFRYAPEPDGELRVRFVREFARPKVRTRHEEFPEDDDIPEVTPPVESVEFERGVAERFMTEVARDLEGSCSTGAYDSLILCAQDELLGILKEKLGECAAGKVAGTIAVDLYEVNETDLYPYIKDILEKRPSDSSETAA